MKIYTQVISGWNWALDAARRTVNKKYINKEPSSNFKKRLLYSEHSPIRTVRFWIDIDGIKQWVSTHLVRHKTGIEHFVGTQRTDRTGKNRDKLFQDEPGIHCMDVNAAEIIFISRKRLCNLASYETKSVWQAILNCLKIKNPELVSVCVPECIYRGFCPESETCGFELTPAFNTARTEYVYQCRLLRNMK